MQVELPRGVHVIERGWLSANNVLLSGDSGVSLIDTSYVGHVKQTIALVEQSLAGQPLTQILNTHCHSDHMGGNAQLAKHFNCPISIPSGEAALIDRWDDRELILGYADQRADRFNYDRTFDAGDRFELGGLSWNVVAAPGHDPHAVMFHAPAKAILISGDALWENGFGIVFGALHGDPTAFALARTTLEKIATLKPCIVIPGHGRVFSELEPALERAFSRLAYFEQDLGRLARSCCKALFLYMLLDKRTFALAELEAYLQRVPVYVELNRGFIKQPWPTFVDTLLEELTRASAIAIEDGQIVPKIKA
jgi:glyoxylase-like metal-dependent hydrolase (beta-lactamase superfamily II)